MDGTPFETRSGSDRPRPDPRAPGVIVLRQSTRAGFRNLVSERAAILRVECGTKILRDGTEVLIPEGALGLLPARHPLDVENRPGRGGPYRATGLLLPQDAPLPRAEGCLGASADPRALQAFDRALDLHRTPSVPKALRDHATVEVLLWLAERGVLLPPEAPLTSADRVRRIAVAALGEHWSASAIAARLAMSEATLRRHLAREGTSLSALLADLRMNHALGLLQTTDLSIGAIAFKVGYSSASRFTARFRLRFGIRPSAIRGQDDRIGRKVARGGTAQAAMSRQAHATHPLKGTLP